MDQVWYWKGTNTSYFLVSHWTTLIFAKVISLSLFDTALVFDTSFSYPFDTFDTNVSLHMSHVLFPFGTLIPSFVSLWKVFHVIPILLFSVTESSRGLLLFRFFSLLIYLSLSLSFFVSVCVTWKRKRMKGNGREKNTLSWRVFFL